jgi:hypothetical protein
MNAPFYQALMPAEFEGSRRRRHPKTKAAIKGRLLAPGALWANTHAAEPAAADVVGEADRAVNVWFNGNEASVDWPQNSETFPILRSEAS